MLPLLFVLLPVEIVGTVVENWLAVSDFFVAVSDASSSGGKTMDFRGFITSTILEVFLADQRRKTARRQIRSNHFACFRGNSGSGAQPSTFYTDSGKLREC